MRTYACIDLKSFYASCECVERGLDPLTTNLVVADLTRTEKTICLAVTPSLKEYGLSGRSRLYEVVQKVKEINELRKEKNNNYLNGKSFNSIELKNNKSLALDYIVAPPQMSLYMKYSTNIYNIYLKYFSEEDIYVYSIDEVFIDVTHYLNTYKMKAKDLATRVIQDVYNTTGITSTCGIGTNLYLAKIALDITAKHSPDRIGWLNEEKYLKELSNHKPITDFWRISSGTAKRLAKYCVYDMEGIRNLDEEILYHEFGIDAELLIDHAKGIETCQMKDIKNYKSKGKSISESQILPCGYSYNDTLIVLKEMVRQATLRLFNNNYVTNSISIGIGYDDIKEGFEAYSTTMNVTTSLYSFIIKYVEELFKKIKYKNFKIRRIGFSLNAIDIKYEHYDLFTNLDDVEKEKRLMKSMINIKDKFGKNSVLEALDYLDNATQRERNLMIGGHAAGDDGKRKKS